MILVDRAVWVLLLDARAMQLRDSSEICSRTCLSEDATLSQIISVPLSSPEALPCRPGALVVLPLRACCMRMLLRYALEDSLPLCRASAIGCFPCDHRMRQLCIMRAVDDDWRLMPDALLDKSFMQMYAVMHL